MSLQNGCIEEWSGTGLLGVPGEQHRRLWAVLHTGLGERYRRQNLHGSCHKRVCVKTVPQFCEPFCGAIFNSSTPGTKRHHLWSSGGADQSCIQVLQSKLASSLHALDSVLYFLLPGVAQECADQRERLCSAFACGLSLSKRRATCQALATGCQQMVCTASARRSAVVGPGGMSLFRTAACGSAFNYLVNFLLK